MAGESTNDDRDDARLGYLTGDDLDAPLDPFDQAELDAMLAVLADETTWDDPPPELGDRVVDLIAVEAAGRPPADRRVLTHVDDNVRRRHFAWVGPAVLGAAAAGLIVFAVARSVDDDEPSFAVDATIDIVGTDLAPGISGTAKIDARQSGLWIQLDLTGLPRRDGGDFYEAWLRSEDGEGLVPIGTFHDASDVVLWAGVAIEDFPIITITLESVAGPKAPEQGSSGEVVARGQLTP